VVMSKIASFADLTDYYLRMAPFTLGGVKNVGWINVESEFSLGEMPKSTLHKLKALATGGGVFQPLVELVR